jgi:hypothetical protein
MNGHLINITDLSAFIDIFATEHRALEDQNAINFADANGTLERNL